MLDDAPTWLGYEAPAPDAAVCGEYKDGSTCDRVAGHEGPHCAWTPLQTVAGVRTATEWVD